MIGVFNVILATFSHLRIGQMMLSLMFDHQPYQYYGELDLLRSIYPYLSLCLRRVLRSIIPCLWLTTVFFVILRFGQPFASGLRACRHGQLVSSHVLSKNVFVYVWNGISCSNSMQCCQSILHHFLKDRKFPLFLHHFLNVQVRFELPFVVRSFQNHLDFEIWLVLLD